MKVLVALDRKTQATPKHGQFAKADIAELGVAKTKIAQTEGEILVVWINLRQ